MKPSRLSITSALLLMTLVAAHAAADTGNFVIKLGTDTTAVERYTRTSSRIEVDQVGRAPRVTLRHYTYNFDSKGAVTSFSVVVTAPGVAPGSPPLQKIDGTCTPDSIITVVARGSNTQTVRVAMPAGSLAIAASSPWVIYEHAMMKLAKGKSDTLRTGLYFIGAGSANMIRLKRLSADSVEVFTDHEDLFHMRGDKSGKLLGALPISGTGKFSVERVSKLNYEGFATEWLAAETRAGAMGALSPRDTVQATAGGAALWIDYGRPGKRGRVVFGEVVPYGEVWRTGANAATQFRTDRALDFGGTTLPVGMYTLWTLPSPGGWKLMVNSETGQWGTEHKPEKDLFTLPMTVSTLPAVVERFTIHVETNAEGGVLHMDWDTTRASIPFRVAAAAN
jgi:hypothetical protein